MRLSLRQILSIRTCPGICERGGSGDKLWYWISMKLFAVKGLRHLNKTQNAPMRRAVVGDAPRQSWALTLKPIYVGMLPVVRDSMASSEGFGG